MSKLLKYKFSIIIALAITYLSLFKTPKMDLNIAFIDNFDKLLHLVMYAALTYSIIKESKIKDKFLTKYFYIFSISTIFGGAMEILQNYFPPRTASWGDFIADAIGSALPLVIITFLRIYDYGHKQNGKADGTEPN